VASGSPTRRISRGADVDEIERQIPFVPDSEAVIAEDPSALSARLDVIGARTSDGGA